MGKIVYPWYVDLETALFPHTKKVVRLQPIVKPFFIGVHHYSCYSVLSHKHRDFQYSPFKLYNEVKQKFLLPLRIKEIFFYCERIILYGFFFSISSMSKDNKQKFLILLNSFFGILDFHEQVFEDLYKNMLPHLFLGVKQS